MYSYTEVLCDCREGNAYQCFQKTEMVSWGKGLNLKSFADTNQAQKENQVALGREIKAKAQRIKRKRQLFWRELLRNPGGRAGKS